MARPIQPDVLSIQDLFSRDNSVHRVPRYQRDYAWKANDEVTDLFTDFEEAYSKYRDDNYFLGQIIVCPSEAVLPEAGKNKVFDLIDGQQRMTTLYLYFFEGLRLAYRQYEGEDAPAEWDQTEKWMLDKIKGSLRFPVPGEKGFFPVVVPASPGIPYLVDKVNDGEGNLEEFGGPTEERLREASEYLAEAFSNLAAKESWPYVVSLLCWVASNVFLFRLETDSEDEALRHFLRLNDRGLGLDQVDIVKSFLFKNVEDSKELPHDTIDEQWHKASSIVMGARLKRLKNMTSLLTFMIVYRTGKFVSNSSSEFSKAWEPYTQKPSLAKTMVNELVPAANAVVDLSKGVGVSPVKYDPDLTRGTRERSATQQIEILVAADKFNPDTYAALLRVVEDRMLLSVWGPEPARDIEPRIHEWSQAVREKNNPDTTPDEVRQMARGWYDGQGFENFSRTALDYAFNEWSYSVKNHRGRILYALARINQVVNAAFDGTRLPLSQLMKSGAEGSSYHIDHIFPQAESQADNWIQSEELDKQLGNASRKDRRIHSIGNLSLLYRKDNLESSKELPNSEKKLAIYRGQNLVLPRALAGPSAGASNWSSSRFSALRDEMTGDMSAWGEEAVITLQNLYRNILQFDMAHNLRIEHSFSDWLTPNP